MLDQVKFDKYPALADLGARYLPGACLFLQRDGMNFEKLGGLSQGERTHDLFHPIRNIG